MKPFALVLGMIFLLCACKRDTSDSQQDVPSSASPPVTTYPALTAQVRNDLVNCNKIDIIFHNLPFSMNLSDNADVRAFQQFFGQGDVNLPVGCLSDGTVLFQQDTLVAAEAELFIEDGCEAFIFKALGKPAFGVPLSPKGVNYFREIISRVKTN